MSRTFLLDTNTFSDLMREHPATMTRLARLAPDDQALVCPTVRGEILYGIGRLPPGRRRDHLRARADHLFEAIPCANATAEAGDRYAQVKLARERLGLPLDENDLWIAATALALGAVLVSRDADVLRVEGLVGENWAM